VNLTRGQACYRLALARYGSQAEALLTEADRWPGRWAYTADRHRAVVKYMPAGRYEVRDTAASEDAIAALARRPRQEGTP
jgi:hypothetical protein